MLFGNDEGRTPRPISEELSKLIPAAVKPSSIGKPSTALTPAKAAVKAFLAKHTPKG